MQVSGAYLDSETERQTLLDKAANDKAVHFSNDGGQHSSDGNSDLSDGDGHQTMEEQRLVAYNKEGKPVRVGIS